MSIQKDLERLVNEAMDAFQLMQDKLAEAGALNDKVQYSIDEGQAKFAAASNALDDIYSEVESLDA